MHIMYTLDLKAHPQTVSLAYVGPPSPFRVVQCRIPPGLTFEGQIVCPINRCKVIIIEERTPANAAPFRVRLITPGSGAAETAATGDVDRLRAGVRLDHRTNAQNVGDCTKSKINLEKLGVIRLVNR